jgi:FkbM family methyltransferase
MFLIPTRNEWSDLVSIEERTILEHLVSNLREDDVFYDIGANIGLYTCFAGQRADRVVAFEPHEQTAARLRENAEGKEKEGRVEEQAAADYEGTASLTHPRRSPEELGTGEFSVLPMEDATDVAEIDVTRIDAVVKRDDLPMPTVAKIDVEGAELQVFRGGEKTLSSCRELFVEVHTDHVAVDEVNSRLTDAGFEVTTLKERGNTEFLWATTPVSSG